MDSKTIEANKLIAEFLGYKFQGDGIGRHFNITKPGETSWYFGSWELEVFHEHIITELPYHLSWDWLMHVVDKIETLGDVDRRGFVNYIVSMDSGYCVISQGGEGVIADYQGENRMDSTYNAVLKFIRWYNSLTSKDK